MKYLSKFNKMYANIIKEEKLEKDDKKFLGTNIDPEKIIEKESDEIKRKIVPGLNVQWSGQYPTLCSGEWSIEFKGKDYSDMIPRTKFKNEMNTFKTYQTWYFNDDNDEIWEGYIDGLKFPEWIAINENWVKPIVEKINEENNANITEEDLYNAFNLSDFRLNSCGGCI